MKLWYKASLYTGATPWRIEPVNVLSTNGSMVKVEGRYKVTNQMRQSGNHKFCESEQEAREFILGLLRERKKEADEQSSHWLSLIERFEKDSE